MKENYSYPDPSTIQAYLDGSLSPQEQRFLEEQALNDPFLADALDGLSMPGAMDLSSKIQKQHATNGTSTTSIWIALAAGAIIMTASATWWMSQDQTSQGMASVQPEEKNQSLMIEQEETSEEEKQISDAERTDSSFTFTTSVPTIKEAKVDVEEKWSVTAEVNQEDIPEKVLSELIVPEPLETTTSQDSEPNSAPDNSNLHRNEERIYHIETYKVVDYRNKRTAFEKPNPLSYTGGVDPSRENSTDEPALELPPRTVSVAYVDYLEECVQLFALEKYRKASRKMQTILEHYPDDANAQFYKGLAEYYLGNYDKSIALLTLSSQNPIVTFSQESQFYLAMSYHRNREQKKACDLMETIAIAKEFYAEPVYA
ncbi:MAG: tetratricopeptide repeat protein [Bacteroidota bacterium]